MIKYNMTSSIQMAKIWFRNKMNKGNAKRGISPRLKFDPVTLTFDLENQ
jgi:hypothetical protein